MPRISSFYGITILMFFGDHNPPHVHARYGGQVAPVALDGTILGGEIPGRAIRLVRVWISLHQAEFEVCGERAINHEPPGTIDPLPQESNLVDVTKAEVVEERTVRLTFSDGSERVVDLAPLLWGPVFEVIARDDELFAEVRVDPTSTRSPGQMAPI